MTRPMNVSKVITPIPPGGYWPDLLTLNYDAASVPASPGFRIADNLGRVFRLVETSEAVAVGNMLTNLVTEVAVAATKFDADPVGATELKLDVTITANAYNGGFLEITEGTGAGYLYPIVSNTAGTAGSSDATIVIESGLVVALSATDTVGIIRNSMFRNVSQHNAANPCVEAPVGRAMAASTTAKPYIWAQTWGPCLLKAGTGAAGAGDSIGLAEDDDGSIETLVTTEDPAFVGNSVAAIADGAWGLCNLMLFP